MSYIDYRKRQWTAPPSYQRKMTTKVTSSYVPNVPPLPFPPQWSGTLMCARDKKRTLHFTRSAINIAERGITASAV
eukprot:scaffold28898_cov37-Prasinocladus_malaysianus.AAC.4